MENASNLQRAIWTFLGYMLVGPLFGGLAIAAILGLAPPFGLGALLPADVPHTGEVAIAAFVWSIIPAAVASLIAVPLVAWRGQLGTLEAAVAGVVGFAVGAIATELPLRDYFMQLAFLAGLVSIAVRQALAAGSIIKT